MSLLVVSCYKSQLASDFAEAFGVPLVSVKTGRFADTENYIDLKDPELLSDAHVLFVHQFNLSRGASGFSVNDQLMDLLFTCDLLKKNGVGKITAVLPYLAYSRQDESFDKKFVGPIKLWGHFFKDAGIDAVVACDLHSNKIHDLFPAKIFEISLLDFWADFIQSNFFDEINKNNLCMVSPDEGGCDRASMLASSLSLPFACIQKERVAPDLPIALKLTGNVKSKVAVVIDDIASTGRTALQAGSMLKLHGAVKIFGIFSHAVFSDGALNNFIKSEYDKIFVTNTLLTPIDKDIRKICVYSVNKYIIEHVSESLT